MKGAWRCHQRQPSGYEKLSFGDPATQRPEYFSGGALYIRWDPNEPGPAVQPRSEFDHHRFRRTLHNETLEDLRNQQCSAKEKRVPENGCTRTIFPAVYIHKDRGAWVLKVSRERYAECLKAIADDVTGSMDDIMKEFGAEWFEDVSENPKLKAIRDEGKAHDDGVNKIGTD